MYDAKEDSKVSSPSDRAPSEGEAAERMTGASSTAAPGAQPQAAAAPSDLISFATDHTPPTMEILDGSLIFECFRKFGAVGDSGVAVRQRRYQSVVQFPIKELKVTDGSANTLYQTHDAGPCTISIWLQDPQTRPDEHVFIQNVSGDILQVDVDNILSRHEDTGNNRQRPHVYRHPGFGGSPPEFNIKKVQIRKGAEIVFTGFEELNVTRTQPKGIHIMLWDI